MVFWARICKRLKRPRFDSKESIPQAFVAWRAGTTTLLVEPARQESILWNRFLGFLKVYKHWLCWLFQCYDCTWNPLNAVACDATRTGSIKTCACFSVMTVPRTLWTLLPVTQLVPEVSRLAPVSVLWLYLEPAERGGLWRNSYRKYQNMRLFQCYDCTWNPLNAAACDATRTGSIKTCASSDEACYVVNGTYPS